MRLIIKGKPPGKVLPMLAVAATIVYQVLEVHNQNILRPLTSSKPANAPMTQPNFLPTPETGLNSGHPVGYSAPKLSFHRDLKAFQMR